MLAEVHTIHSEVTQQQVSHLHSFPVFFPFFPPLPPPSKQGDTLETLTRRDPLFLSEWSDLCHFSRESPECLFLLSHSIPGWVTWGPLVDGGGHLTAQKRVGFSPKKSPKDPPPLPPYPCDNLLEVGSGNNLIEEELEEKKPSRFFFQSFFSKLSLTELFSKQTRCGFQKVG